jgi:hypothetical protein
MVCKCDVRRDSGPRGEEKVYTPNIVGGIVVCGKCCTLPRPRNQPFPGLGTGLVVILPLDHHDFGPFIASSGLKLEPSKSRDRGQGIRKDRRCGSSWGLDFSHDKLRFDERRYPKQRQQKSTRTTAKEAKQAIPQVKKSSIYTHITRWWVDQKQSETESRSGT